MIEYKRDKPERGYYPEKPPMILGWMEKATVEHHLAEAIHELNYLKEELNLQFTNRYEDMCNEIKHHILMAWDKSK